MTQIIIGTLILALQVVFLDIIPIMILIFMGWLEWEVLGKGIDWLILNKKSMNRFTFLFIFFFVNMTLYSQDVKEKWVSSVYVDLNSTYESRYWHGTFQFFPEYSGSIELAYNLDYKIFKRFSFGSIVSLNRFLSPKISSLKIGGAIKYY